MSGRTAPERDTFADAYDHLAGGYARRFGVSSSDGRAHAFRRLGPRPDETVLDLACGPGQAVPRLAAGVGPGGRVIAIDRAARMLDLARGAAAGHSNVSLVRADLACTGLAAASCDAVLCAHGLHFAHDLAATLTEIARVLRPGGRFSASIARDAAPTALASTLARFLESALEPVRAPAGWQLTHDTVADDASIIDALTAAGFAGVALETGRDTATHDTPAEYVRSTLGWWGYAGALRELPLDEAREIAQAALDIVRRHWCAPVEVETPWVALRCHVPAGRS